MMGVILHPKLYPSLFWERFKWMGGPVWVLCLIPRQERGWR